jgi:hypothetical protein
MDFEICLIDFFEENILYTREENTMKMRIMKVKKCVPKMVSCNRNHQFEATKVYSMTDSDGSEFGIVICPTHLHPIPANIEYTSVAH